MGYCKSDQLERNRLPPKRKGRMQRNAGGVTEKSQTFSVWLQELRFTPAEMIGFGSRFLWPEATRCTRALRTSALRRSLDRRSRCFDCPSNRRCRLDKSEQR